MDIRLEIIETWIFSIVYSQNTTLPKNSTKPKPNLTPDRKEKTHLPTNEKKGSQWAMVVLISFPQRFILRPSQWVEINSEGSFLFLIYTIVLTRNLQAFIFKNNTILKNWEKISGFKEECFFINYFTPWGFLITSCLLWSGYWTQHQTPIY